MLVLAGSGDILYTHERFKQQCKDTRCKSYAIHFEPRPQITLMALISQMARMTAVPQISNLRNQRHQRNLRFRHALLKGVLT